MNLPVVLCIDDDPNALHRLQDVVGQVKGDRFDLETIQGSRAGLDRVARLASQGRELIVAIVAQKLKDIPGDDLLVRLKITHPHTAKVLIYASGDTVSTANAVNNGGAALLMPASWEDQDMLTALDDALAYYQGSIAREAHHLLYANIAAELASIHQATDAKAAAQLVANLMVDKCRADRLVLAACDPTGSPHLLAVASANREEARLLKNRLQHEPDKLLREVVKLKTTLAQQDAGTPQTARYLPLMQGKTERGFVMMENLKTVLAPSEQQLQALEVLGNYYMACHNPALATARVTSAAPLPAKGIETESAGTTTPLADAASLTEAIQRGFLQGERHLRSFFPEAFLIDKPAATGTQGFFWMGEKFYKLHIAVGQTSLPAEAAGYFNLVATNLLEQLAGESPIYEAGQLVQRLGQHLKARLEPDVAQALFSSGFRINYAILDLSHSDMEWFGAGMGCTVVHNRNTTELKPQWPNGLTLDLLTESPPYHRSQRLYNGDTLYFYSDGMAQQPGPDGGAFGTQRLMDLIAEAEGPTPGDQRNVLLRILENWMGSTPQAHHWLALALKLNNLGN